MNSEQKKSRGERMNLWLSNLYYVGTLVSLLFILAQVYYAKRSMVESSEWEKAKITIENIERFKAEISSSPLNSTEIWLFSDKLWPDFSTPEGQKASDTLRVVYVSLFNDSIIIEELVRSIDIMNAFAYPIIMGYASEIESSQSVIRQYYTYGNYIMPFAFNDFPNIGHHAKLLYRLWRIRYEQLIIDICLADPDNDELKKNMTENMNNLLFFEDAEISPASLKKYKNTLKQKFKEMEKEIATFRKNSLK